MKQIEKNVETKDMCLQSLVSSDSLNQTKLSCKIDTGIKTRATSIQKFGEVVVESKPCELTFAREKNKQAQFMLADLSPPMSVDNMQPNLKLKINKNMRSIRRCSLHPDGRVVFSCSSTNTVRCFTKDGVEIFQIWKEKNDPILMIQYILKITIVLLYHREVEVIDA